MRVVLEALRGVTPFILRELARALPDAQVLASRETEVVVEIPEGSLPALRALHTPVAAYQALTFPIRRPRELLATENLAVVAAVIAGVKSVRPRMPFTSLRLGAAGADTPEFQRVAEEWAARAGLGVDPRDGDLLIRVRQDPDDVGWQVLVRITPRPLSARAWRVANYPGAVNATIAAAVVDLLEPRPGDRFTDLMCGSGTIVLERLARGPAARVVACDINPEAIAAARANQRAARFKGAVEWICADMRTLDPGEDGFDRLVANPPWGELLGDHDANDELYADLLTAAARMAGDEGRFVVLTHDIRRFERLLGDQGDWEPVDVHRFFQKGHHPRAYLLHRTPARVP